MKRASADTLRIDDLSRINQISKVLARHGFGHLLSQSAHTASDTPNPPDAARRLREACIELGPTFVKLGQLLSVRPDIVPSSFASELQSLQDHVPPMPRADVERVVEDALQQPLTEVFASFSAEPLGSASIAQVHAARLHDGNDVVVKVQRRDIERSIRSDLSILYAVARLLEGRIELPGIHTPRSIVQEFEATITGELDFHLERRNAQRFARHMSGLADRVVVPKVFAEWSSQRVLVMERIDGVSLRDALPTLEPESARARRIAHTLMEATFHQVFEAGFFHGDPHPGNLLLTPDDKLAYVDFGATGQLTSAMQDTLVTAFTSLVFRDAQSFATTLYHAGAAKGRVDLKHLARDLDRMLNRYYGASLGELVTPHTLTDVIDVYVRHGIGLPSEYALLSRALTLAEGIVRDLLPASDFVEEVMPFARRLAARRLRPERLAQDAAKVLTQAQVQLRDLPTQLDQLMVDLQGGTLRLIAQDPDSKAIQRELRHLSFRFTFGAIAAAALLGATILIAADAVAPASSLSIRQLAALLGGVSALLVAVLAFHALWTAVRWPALLQRLLSISLRFFRRRAD